MIQPGAKNWIEKFFSLIEEGEIDLNSINCPEELSMDEFLHNLFFDTGIVFGYPSEFLFYKNEEVIAQWTVGERAIFLLLECLVFLYTIEKGSSNKDDFVSSVLEFYKEFDNLESKRLLGTLFKESEVAKLENLLKGRSHVKSTLKNKLWASYMSNSLIYLDILGYRSFLKNHQTLSKHFHEYAKDGLYTVSIMAQVDNDIEQTEQLIIASLLNSANFSGEEQALFQEKLYQSSFDFSDLKISPLEDKLYRFYLLDLAVLTVHSDLSVLKEEVESLKKMCLHLGLEQEWLDISMILISRFVMKNNDKITFLSERTNAEQLYSNFSKRWIKVLGRNKDKVVSELKESKELIALVNKSFTQELTAEEKTKVRSQFGDIIKTVPALAIFMLPGGMLLLPIILKIIPDLIPSSFKNNEV